MEEEQLQALLRDLDALKQRPDDPASIDRVTPSPAAPLPGSRQFASASPLCSVPFQLSIPVPLTARCGSGWWR